MVEGGITLVKYILFFANFILWTIGLALIVSGAVLQLKYTGLLDILGDERLATPLILLFAGCLCTLLGFVGYCGAIRENYCLTVTFGVLLATMLMVEIGVAIAAYALHEPLHNSLVEQLSQGMSRYNKSKGVALAWNQVQRNLRCCGLFNASDWHFPYLPDSCCVHYQSGCAKIPKPMLHEAGCVERLEHWVIQNAAVLGCASAILAVGQVIGVCFACCLSKSILKDFQDFYY